mmetsp:Transcript_25214/g.42238  ORF Transcript_25214/g.42238 Transcript_25214/m.42238 type:complete len:490 (+) Transcript_25214:120-1589(+)
MSCGAVRYQCSLSVGLNSSSTKRRTKKVDRAPLCAPIGPKAIHLGIRDVRVRASSLTGGRASVGGDRKVASFRSVRCRVAGSNDSVPAGGDATFEQSLFNSVNILLGVGLLSVPYAIAEGGWAALLVLLILGLTTNYTGKILIKCQESQCLLPDDSLEPGCVPLGSYEAVGEAAFGPLGRKIITSVLYTELIGTCGLFFILEGDHISVLLNSGPESKVMIMIASALVMVPTTWFRDLSGLSKLGFLGACASFGMLGVILYTFVSGGGLAGASPEAISSASLVHAGGLPLTFGLLAFVFAGHAVFPNIYISMEDRSRYPELLQRTYVIVGATCAAVGVLGYLMYGDSVADEVTLNLPAGALSTIALMLTVINPLAKFGLTMAPVVRGFDQQFGLEGEDKAMQSIVGRTGLGFFALVLATSVPDFALFMALLGSFLTLTVSIIFPSLCYLKIFGPGLSQQEKWLNYFTVGLGCFCAVSGTTAAITGLQSGT